MWCQFYRTTLSPTDTLPVSSDSLVGYPAVMVPSLPLGACWASASDSAEGRLHHHGAGWTGFPGPCGIAAGPASQQRAVPTLPVGKASLGKATATQSWVSIENDVRYRFFMHGLSSVEAGSLCVQFLEHFYHKWMVSFVWRLFFFKYWDDLWFFSRNRGSDIQNKPMNTKGGKWDELGV